MSYQIVQIGDLALGEPGSFKIGPFGSSLKKDELVSSGIPVIGIENILPNDFVPSYRKYITEKKYQELAQYTVQPGDIAVTTMGTIGRAAVIPEGIGTAIIDSHLFRMRFDKTKVYPPYLCYAINGAPSVINHLEKMSRGAIMDGLNTTILKESPLALPPLTQQKRIASLLGRADRLRQLRRTAHDLGDALLQSVFLEMFGHVRINDKKWELAKFEDVCETRLGKMLDDKKQTGKNKRPYLRNFNVRWHSLDLSDIAEMDFDEKDRKEFRLQYGDVLICEGGEVGRAAIWRNEMEECYFQKALHRARPNSKLANPEYIVHLLWWMAQTGGLVDSTSQVTFAHLTGEKLKELVIPVPPLSLQEEFAGVVRRVESLRGRMGESERQVEGLFESLLAKSFSS